MAIVAGNDILASDFVSSSAGAGDSGKAGKFDGTGKFDISMIPGVTTSAGAGDSGKVPKLNASGKLDESFLVAGAIKTLTALESISAAAAVATGMTQTSAIGYDTSGIDRASTTTITSSVTIGTHSNRVFVVLAFTARNGGAGGTVSGTFAGQTLTFTALSTSTNYVVSYAVLVAPPQGSGAFNLSNSGGNTFRGVAYFSLYNCAQTAADNAAGVAQDSGTTISVTMTSSSDGVIAVGAMTDVSGTSNIGTPAGNVYVAHTATTTNIGSAISDSDATVVYPAGSTFTLSTSGATANPLGGIVTIKPFNAVSIGVQNASSASVAAPNTRCTGFLGFANSGVTVGQSLAVTIGGIVTGLSGLSLGTRYYLNDSNGTIGTAAGSNSQKVGIAVTSTTLLITNIW